MKIEKNNVILSVLIVLCVVALTLTIKVSRDIIENKRTVAFNELQLKDKDIKKKDYRFKLDDFKLIYNGKELSEKAYITSGKTLLPIDNILRYNNIKYRAIDSEDVLAFFPNDKEFRIDIGNDKALLPSAKSLDVWSIFKDGHIYCESELFKNFGNFSIRTYEDTKSVFMFSNSLFEKVNFPLNIIKSSSNGIEFFDLNTQNTVEKPKLKDSSLVYSDYYKGCFFIGKNYVLDINQNKEYTTGYNLSITQDGKNFYYFERNTDELIIFDIQCNELFRIKNISNIISLELLNQNRLYSVISSEGKQRKLLFVNNKNEIDEAIIYKSKGELRYIKNVDISPKKNKMIYIEEKILFLADLLGNTDLKIYQDVDSAKWITNDKILLIANNEKYLYSVSKGVKVKVYNDLKYLGSSSNGVYYKLDNSIMFTNGDSTNEVDNTQINIKSIIPFDSGNALIIIPDSTSDSIYLHYKGEFKKVGAKPKGADSYNNPLKFISISPKQDKVVILETEGKFTALNIINIKDDSKNQRILVDFRDDELDNFIMEWVDSDKLICYSNSKLFLIDTLLKDKIFTWNETNSKIERVMVK